ncbi:MAG: transcription-repair coupling factor, partial [Prevotella sp.]|nr:transcription-repair coupling factor [Prevotella sp.]
MEIRELQSLYSKLPQIAAVDHAIADKSVRALFLEGLIASSAPMVFSGLAKRSAYNMLFVLQDADEAGYFYHDLSQIIGDGVLFFPSSYRRAVKYGQRDAASEILRTEVLAAIARSSGVQECRSVDNTSSANNSSTCQLVNSSTNTTSQPLYIVSYPEAIAELVVSQKNLDDKTISLQVGQTVDVDQLLLQLRQLGFREVDYVYEPGQFALRGSILDVFSYSGEYPYRIDLFGDDIDSIRTFEVENQLSRDKRDGVDIVPELADGGDKVPLLSFLPEETIIVVKDMAFVRDSIDRTYQEGFSVQAIAERTEGATEMEQRDILEKMRSEVQLITGQQFMRDALEYKRIEFGHRPLTLPDTTITFNITPQPLFHKNFELLQKSL